MHINLYWTRFILITNLTLFLSVCGYTQFGSRVQYLSVKTSSELQDQVHYVNGSGYEASLIYWFRLKNLRIEFLPEVNYGAALVKGAEISSLDKMTRYGIALPVSIYPFDLEGDCKCPTFSKQNDLFKKGFFVQLAPTLQRFQSILTSGAKSDWNEQFSFGMGAGLDLGISDLVTLTPMVHYFTSIYRNGSSEIAHIKNDLRVGIRVMFRLDYP